MSATTDSRGINGQGEASSRSTVALALVLVYIVVLLRTAWMCDDAFITARTVDNFLQGFGLRWNVADRVQTYTHPLWALLLSAVCGTTRELYLTTIVVSMVTSTLAVALVLAKLSRSTVAVVAAGILFVLSPGFVAFSTSGMENPLSFLLSALFLIVFLRHRPSELRSLVLGLLAGLALVNRLDHVWLYAPALAFDLLQGPSWRRLRAMAVGLTPLVAWFAFALVYYGFLLPNSAYAKLGTGYGHDVYIREGVRYLHDALVNDTLLTVIIAVAVVGASATRSGARRAMALGILLYVGYTVMVGGDFMRGRLLSVPFFIAVALLLDADFLLRGRWRVLALAPALALGVSGLSATLFSGPGYGADVDYRSYDRQNACDERAYYFQRYGLLNGKPLAVKWGHNMQQLRERQAREIVDVKLIMTAGMGGLVTGPHPCVVDHWALGDPLLARLPVTQPWARIGHFHRAIPSGYLATLVTGENQIKDARIHQYYDDLRLVTRGALFTRDRWSAIVRMNLGRDDYLVRDNKSYAQISVHDYVDLADGHIKEVGPKILWEAGRYHARRKELDQATAIIHRLGELDIAYSDSYITEALNLGLVYAHRGDVEAGEKLIRAVYQAEPGDAGAAYALGKLLVDSGRSAEAVPYLEEAAEIGHPSARRDLQAIEPVNKGEQGE